MHRKNNFDFIRLVFAVFVIVSHAYPLTGSKVCDWLCINTNGQVMFSYIGVKGFFILSGYLIFQSLQRSETLIEYYWKRILRLFPGLALVLIITILFVYGVYDQTYGSYWTNESVWAYFKNNILLFQIQYSIPGVFENNPYPNAINGSLWTIPFEFSLYILLSMLFYIRQNNVLSKISISIFFLLFILIHYMFSNQLTEVYFILNGQLFFELGAFFLSGAFLGAFEIEKIRFKNSIIIIFSILIVISLYFNFFYLIKLFALPIVVILFGISSTKFINSIGNKIGDLSYGIYLYSFPVQQILVYFFHLDVYELILSSTIISAIFAYLSWHLVEKKALKLKNMGIGVNINIKEKLTNLNFRFKN
jgi:peptidoglycan/LPS O-acetylase OafA/YrhL